MEGKISVLALGALAAALNSAAQTPVYPANFVARLYTEGLGRIADTTSPGPGADPFGGVRFWSRDWQPGRACDKAFLKEIAVYILDPYNPGSEFNVRWAAHLPENTPYGVAAMYRALLAREPDQGGLDYWSDQIANRGYPWWAFRNALIDSGEFQLSNYCPPADQIQNAAFVGFGQRMFHGDIPVPAPGPVPPVQLFSQATVTNFANAGRTVPPTPTYTSSEVQCKIDKAAAGDAPFTVELAHGALIGMDTQIAVHGGVTLTTAAGPDSRQYLKLARFVRQRGYLPSAAPCPRPGGGYYARPGRTVKASDASGPIAWVDSMFDIRPGATMPDGTVRPNRLERVWVDGGRGSAMTIDPYYGAASNVSLFGAGAVLRQARVDNSPAATTIYAGGQKDSGHFPDCPLTSPRYTTHATGPLLGSNYSQELSDLLITVYSSRYGMDAKGGGTQVWTDGIQVVCENALVAHNEIVDATDGGIIVFGSFQHKQQRSHVDSNSVLNAGNFAGWGIAWDPGWTRNGNPLGDSSWRLTWNFNGARFSSNWIEALEHRSLTFFPLAAGSGMLWKIPRTDSEVPASSPNQMLFVFGGGVGSSSAAWPKVEKNIVRGSSKVAISIYGMKDVLFSENDVARATRSAFGLNFGNPCPAPPPTPVLACADDSNVCATPLAVFAASKVLQMGTFNSPGPDVGFDACLGSP